MCACEFCVVKCVHHKCVCNGGIVHCVWVMLNCVVICAHDSHGGRPTHWLEGDEGSR